jgi:hypothetical protein
VKLLLFVLFQIAWLGCVLGAAAGRPWLGAAVAAATLAVYFRRRGRAEPVVAAGVVGTAGDFALAESGLVAYSGGLVWIGALWLAFGMLLDAPLRWLHGRLGLAAVLSAVGGGLAYVGGERLGAIDLRPGGLVAVCIVYALVVPALLWWVARR